MVAKNLPQTLGISQPLGPPFLAISHPKWPGARPLNGANAAIPRNSRKPAARAELVHIKHPSLILRSGGDSCVKEGALKRPWLR